MDLLNHTIQDILNQIKGRSGEALIAVRKRKDKEVVHKIWYDFCVNMKMQLEKLAWDSNLQHVKWLYAYLQNRNQVITINMETRIGKGNMKKHLDKSGRLMIDLLAKRVQPRIPCEVCAKVDNHLMQLSSGRHDIVVGKNVLVSDYPDEYKYKEPATVLAPRGGLSDKGPRTD